jgi:ABC-2 type transport system ATP-binding protein
LQRVGLAQILLGKPRLCFLDEPTSGMDPIGMALVRDLLLRWKAEGTTVVLNSHHLHEVERVCDRVAFIQSGKIQAIEGVKEPVDGLLYRIHWEPSPNNNESVILAQVCETAGATIKASEQNSAQVQIKNTALAAAIIKNLVENGVAICEATLERKPLLDLFVQSEAKVLFETDAASRSQQPMEPKP